MRTNVPVLVTTIMLVAGLSAIPVHAGGLLKGVTDTVSNTVGSVTDTVSDTVDSVTDTVSDVADTVGDTVDDVTGGGLVVGDVLDVGGGPASTTSLVNGGIGGKPNVLEVRVGKGQKPIALAKITNGSNLVVGLNLLGLGLDLTIPGVINILGGGDDDGDDNNNNGKTRVASLNAGGIMINCSVNDGRKAIQIAAKAKVDKQAIAKWQRAANVRIVPVKLCPAAKAQVAKLFSASSKVKVVQAVAAKDALIAASLSRTSYNAQDVFAVQSEGGQLAVYVY